MWIEYWWRRWAERRRRTGRGRGRGRGAWRRKGWRRRGVGRGSILGCPCCGQTSSIRTCVTSWWNLPTQCNLKEISRLDCEYPFNANSFIHFQHHDSNPDLELWPPTWSYNLKLPIPSLYNHPPAHSISPATDLILGKDEEIGYINFI